METDEQVKNFEQDEPLPQRCRQISFPAISRAFASWPCRRCWRRCSGHVSGAVINATSLANFRFFLNPRAVVIFCQEAFVNAAENVNGNGIEIVGDVDRKFVANNAKGFSINLKAGAARISCR